MKRPYLLLACLSPVACLMAASGQKGGKNKQKVNDRQLPNVVFIYADDLGYGDLECYGAKNVQTPNVNRLASEGIRFTNAHATAATSTPSRYSMLTGEYAWRRPGTDVAAGNAGMIIRPEDYTMADMFKNSGYVTAALGKWHLGLGIKAESKTGMLHFPLHWGIWDLTIHTLWLLLPTVCPVYLLKTEKWQTMTRVRLSKSATANLLKENL